MSSSILDACLSVSLDDTCHRQSRLKKIDVLVHGLISVPTDCYTMEIYHGDYFESEIDGTQIL